jgi:hypothetical protein
VAPIIKRRTMPEYFIVANSFAASFASDYSFSYVNATSPEVALEIFAANYKHPFKLYAAMAYSSSDAKNKGENPLARWLCNKEIALEKASKDKSIYSYTSFSDEEFEIDGRLIKVDKSGEGRVVPYG